MRRVLLLVVPVFVRCATLAESAGGDQNLPSSGVGPFRKLSALEVNDAPYVLDFPTSRYREPATLPLSGAVALYVVVADSGGQDVIARTRATDGRAFFGATQDFGHEPQRVLASDQAWESADLAYPSALTVGSAVFLYYTSNGSVGLAHSTDGLSFTKVASPVLTADALGVIASASVAQFPDATFHMMFAQANSIYEAVSTDGIAWQRVDADPSTPAMDPVLSPATADTPLAPGQVPPFDTLRVADPCLLPRTTAGNRLQVRVLYTGFAPAEGGVASAIGFAARYGDSGMLVRATGAVYSVSKHESSPALYENGGISLLYVAQDSTDGTYPAIAAAVSPPTATLPLEAPYPPTP